MTVPTQSWSLTGPATPSQRDGLVQFWLSAPQDQLEPLWNSGFGEITRRLVKELTPQHPFTTDQVATRNSIGEQLHQGGLNQPLAAQLMLANFLLSPPGLLTINNVNQFFPAWLVAAYQELYGQPPSLATPPLPPQSASVPTSPQPSHPTESLPPVPDFGPFPATLQELITNRIQLNRLLGLSNLYYIDPEDREICDELVELRRHLVDAIERCPEQELAQLWSTELGERYWALVRSGVQKEPLAPEDEARKQKATTILNPQLGGGFGKPGAINAFLIVMVYFMPGSMKVDDAEQKLPAWLLPAYQEVFAKALPV